MKYQNNTKWDRNKAIIDKHRDHPELALQEIADEFKISKARVSQIIIRDRVRNGK